MKYLVTGAAGFIGSCLTEKLLENPNNQVIVYDNLMYKQRSLLHLCHKRNLEFVYGDVRDTEKLLPCIKQADVVAPLAALVGADACEKDKRSATEINHHQLRWIASQLSKNQQLLSFNTNSGYGVGGSSHCTEDSPLCPVSHYGRTKCDGEREVLEHGGVSLRLATVFGVSARQRLDLLVNDFVYKALTDGYIVLFEKNFRRNYIHLLDVVKAFLFVTENYDKCRGEAFNVGLSSANLTKYELALKVKEHVPNFSIQCDEIRQDKDKRDYIVGNVKLERLGWKPDYTLDDGIIELKKAFSMLFAGQQIYTNL